MPGSPRRAWIGHSEWISDLGHAKEIFSELEKYVDIDAGKYTIGLGQAKMGFCTHREEINSLCMPVVQNLVERNDLSYDCIGRMEVGKETIIDKSESGDIDVEGTNTTHAFYGAPAAVFSVANWIESSSWDGQFALEIVGDIAVYPTGNVRLTGGVGAVALLIRSNASIFERGLRGTHMQCAYDFYEPDMLSECPIVDEKPSIQCCFSALDHCYSVDCKKIHAQLQKEGNDQDFTLNNFGTCWELEQRLLLLCFGKETGSIFPQP
uniref:Hydroxymethylglutaryl-CoA synthase n=1 Tax=Piliocolobus tephrosceles TaxID=591936 RepID=A0A8C9IZK6_9PRIM